MKILIADDDPLSRHLLRSTLNRLHHEVVQVSDGSAALEALLKPDGPCLAILDWMMPGADGLTVCRTLRRRPTPYVYVILLTGKNAREDMETAVEAGVDDFLTKPFDVLELRARLRSAERVLNLQEGLLRMQAKLHEQATHDHLTGLWNRSGVLAQLSTELERAARDFTPLSIVMADIDYFKRVNDRYGHNAGDVVLRETAARMRSVMRTYDGLGRYGGEEFLMILPGCDATAAIEIAERARVSVAAEPARVDTFELPMSISLGIACTADFTFEANGLIAAADGALYRAKALGRNRVER